MTARTFASALLSLWMGVLTAGCGGTGDEGAADFKVTTDGGNYLVVATPSTPISLNQRFGLTMRVADAKDPASLVRDAQLFVELTGPGGQTARPSRSALTEAMRLEDGGHVVDDLILEAPGTWRLTIEVAQKARSERASVELNAK